MAIKVPQGFEVQSKQPIDSRILLTKQQMIECSTPDTAAYNTMPVKYFVICVDDGKLYLYDKTAQVDPEIGLFKEVTADISGDISAIESQVEALNAELEKKQDEFDPGEGLEFITDSEGHLILNAHIDSDVIANQLPAALRKVIEEQTEESGLVVDSEGNIKVSLDEEYLTIDSEGRITFTNFIIQAK